MNSTVRSENIVRRLAAICCFAVSLSVAQADELKEARVTQVVKDVKLLPEQAAPRPATVNDPVRDGTAVRTGVQSRSELTFTDRTITRLGANTIFSFKEGTRIMDLGEGAILFQVPKGEGGATIRTAAVTAAITGTTGIGEFHHVTANNPHPVIKWLCLEGTIHLYLTNGSKESVELHPGQMEVTDGTKLSTPVGFDINQLVKTSLLVSGFDTPLPSLPLITIEIQRQIDSRLAGGLNGTLLALNDPSQIADEVDRGMTAQNIVNSSPSPTEAPTVTPTVSPTVTPTVSPTVTPTPSKTGTPEVIVSSTPYAITASTTITTDPSITTNGITDYGKIYRSQADDGAFSLWAFGSTSAFDTALGVDNFFTDPNHFPIAVFKFESLSLNGNPIIDTSNGGVTKLALIGVDGITSGQPGGTLTFTGLDLLALGTVNGSINLTSDISFQDISALAMYARGAGSNLILDSPISNIGDLKLGAEGSIQLTNPNTMNVGQFEATAGNDLTLQIGGSLLFDGKVSLDAIVLPGATVTSGANLTVDVTGDYTNSSTSELSRLNVENVDGHIGTGGNMLMHIGGNFFTGFDSEFAIDNVNGTINNGGNLTLTVGGNLTAGSLLVSIDNTSAGVIDSDAAVNLGIAGSLTSQADATFQILNDQDPNIGTGGGIGIGIGGSATIDVTANTLSAGALESQINNMGGSIGGHSNINFTIVGNLTAASIDALINNRNGGSIASGADLIFDIGGALTTTGDASFITSNRNDGNGGGTIGANVFVTLQAARVSVGGFLAGDISTNGGGNIPNATVNVNVDGDLVATGGAEIDVQNTGFNVFGGPFISGAMIGMDAKVNVNAGSVSTGDLFDVEIDNNGASHIGRDAIINIDVTNDVNVQADAFIEIVNTAEPSGEVLIDGGTISRNATTNFAAGDVTTQGAFEIGILNNDHRFLNAGGNIGGDAEIIFSAANVSSTDFFNLVINDAQGSIGGASSIAAHASSISTDNTFFAHILNEGGQIGESASVSFVTTGAISAGLDAIFEIANPGGTIGGDATLNVNAGNIATGATLFASIDNTSKGSIGGNAVINMNVTGNATVTTDATIQIFGSDAAKTAMININGGNYDVGGTFFNVIDGNGTIAFNNASVHADVLKVGAFGTNGVLNIGGGTLSADTTLKLYAPGSNGQLNFISNVTLGGNSAKILAANSITILDNVVVTIGGTNPADVFTNNANYSESSGGNDSTTGTFAGAGANSPQPLSEAPPFGTSVSAPSVASHPPAAGHPPRGITHSPNPAVVQGRPPRSVAGPRAGGNNRPARIVTVRDSDELISLIERTTHGDNGHAAPRDVTRTNDRRNPTRTNVAGTTNIGRSRADIGSSFSPSANRLP